MAAAGVQISQTPFFRTARRDLWWAQWLAYFAGLGFFLAVYPLWAVLQGNNYRFGNYTSPFYSPELFGSAKAWLGVGRPSFWPALLPFSPALLIIWAPAGFRLTCYYFRGAYYKAFFFDPPGCTVGEPRHSYWGENFWPLLVHNAHRYFMYLAVVLLIPHAYDVWEAMWFTDPATGREVFGIGLGTIALAVDVTLLWGYVMGCHSLRSAVGGNLNWFSKAPLRAKCWACTSVFNGQHRNFALTSLVWISFCDFYVRMLAMGVIHDFRVLL
ncbi:MAG TPA: hypothetical protein VEC38_06890 [Candidatus Binataceae bacterium]|nr:hypothetical protein [Candidatus Binataceae bacterium]